LRSVLVILRLLMRLLILSRLAVLRWLSSCILRWLLALGVGRVLMLLLGVLTRDLGRCSTKRRWG
jgi:hypothetical protein